MVEEEAALIAVSRVSAVATQSLKNVKNNNKKRSRKVNNCNFFFVVEFKIPGPFKSLLRPRPPL